MMLAPNGYYEFELEGRSRGHIRRRISSLKRRMSHLKRTMEHPYYKPTYCPTEATQLAYLRMYLDVAKVALLAKGEEYEPTAAELAAMDFEDGIDNISKITLTFKDMSDGSCAEYIATLDDKLRLEVNDDGGVLLSDNRPLSKKEFLGSLDSLHIGEWRKKYGTARFGVVIFGGASWSVNIEYRDGRPPFVSGGCNAYPYNFGKFAELFGLDFSPLRCYN